MNVLRKRKIYNKFITLILIGVAIVLPFICIGGTKVEAVANPSITLKSEGVSAVVNDCNSDFNSITGSKKGIFKIKGARVYMYMDRYSGLSSDEKKEVMTAILNNINKSDLPQNTRLRFYNFVSEQDESVSSLVRQLSNDVNADFATAYSWFLPFSGTVSTILGFLAIVIFVTLGLMITVDLAYLVIPPFRSAIEKTDGSKPSWVSNEAYKATLEVEKGEGKSKSTMGLYLKYKSTQMIILGICLLYLVSGKIYTLVAWIIDSFSGVIG